ncbi:SurA N-terminal domain-containing protein [Pseudonocardia sp. GCM10023141]|uniref:SurA N-terminal domain-containing protein n=1 Tax=Pseudonocardia sp. GCM10023141 TaxID=3252653 RepID=UPI00360EBFAB
MRTQVGRVLAAVVVVGAVVSGCGSVQPGAAVIVGPDAVAVSTVQSQLDAVLKRTDLMSQVTAQGGTAADVARDVVTRSVMHQLLQRQAAATGVVVSDAAVDAAIAAQGGLDKLLATSLTDATGLRDRVRDDLTAAELAKRAVGGLSVTADLIASTSKEDAQAKAKILAAGGPAADALFKAGPQTTAKGMAYQAATNPGAASAVLFGTPVGTTVYYQPNPQQASWIVFKITNRQTDGPVDPAAVAKISQDELVAIGERMMQPVGKQAGIDVNPRYGVWDPIQLRVVAADGTAGEILPSAAG